MVTTAKKSATTKPTKRRSGRSVAKKSTTTSAVQPAVQSASRSLRPALKINRDYLSAVGRRKSSIARVRLQTKGGGQITVNNQELAKYFSLADYINTVLAPLSLVGLEKTVDITIKVSGGGKAGQAIACRHGLARVLLLVDENYRKQLRPAGFLTRDARVKERKKPGLKRARRAPQFSKR